MNEPEVGTVRRAFERASGRPWRARAHGLTGFALTAAPMTVIISWAPDIETPGVEWLHASIGHRTRMPRYEELKLLHASVFGDRWAYEVFAPAAHHVNEHEFARHLWGRLDGAAVLPNFGRYGHI